MRRRFHAKNLVPLLIALMAGWAWPAAAATDLAGATLEVNVAPGAESCSGAEALRSRALNLGTPRAEPTAPLAISVEFRPQAGGYAATVGTLGKSAGTRELSAAGPGCNPLAAATSVVLAVLLDLLPPDQLSAAPAEASPAFSPEESAPSPFGYVGLSVHSNTAYGLIGPAPTAGIDGSARVRPLPLSRHWAVRMGLGVIVPFREYTMVVDRVGGAYDPLALAGTFAFGPELRFR